MRSRNIKPGFFENEDLAECSHAARLLFIGLWCMADREGRLECRTARLKAKIFPYDNCKVGPLLNELLRFPGLVKKYVISGVEYLQITNFVKHQFPHHREKPSEIPPIPDEKAQGLPGACQGQAEGQAVPRSVPAHLNPESCILNPDTDNIFVPEPPPTPPPPPPPPSEPPPPPAPRLDLLASIPQEYHRLLSTDKDGTPYLETKSGKSRGKLHGKRLTTFFTFWETFDYKKGMREAANAWERLPPLRNGDLEEILKAAKLEAQARPAMKAAGKTPKMAQGWISGYRWEDYAGMVDQKTREGQKQRDDLKRDADHIRAVEPETYAGLSDAEVLQKAYGGRQ